MARREHPADVHTRALLATATSYLVHFRKGPAEIHRAAAATEAEARGVAADFDRTHGGGGRRSIIYAVLPDGRTMPLGEPYNGRGRT
jgi:hypothetical protein